MAENDDRIIYLVHCVDTEGPKYESPTAIFELLETVYGIKEEPNPCALARFKRGEGVPHHLKEAIIDFLSDERRGYKNTWADLDAMLDEILSSKWRTQYLDDFDNGYVFTWFILDHVGFTMNPRRKPMGYHAVFEHYLEKLTEHRTKGTDEIQWHFHPVSFTHEGHKCSNSFSFTDEHLQVLSRRIIDHLWFPSAFRPGQHTERPDINLWLEQWIPFDYGNQGMAEPASDGLQLDMSAGRFGDWRRATREWEVYHPDYRDYQVKGNMRRYIARCLNLSSRIRQINDEEIEKAFRRADDGKRTIMAVTDHDEREMRAHIDNFYATVRRIQKKYPRVKIKNSTAAEAMREAEGLAPQPPIELEASLDRDHKRLEVKTNRECWGPQPWLCFKTLGGQYCHENLDYHGGMHWSYVFDDTSIDLKRLEKIGLATNDSYGNTSVCCISVESGEVRHARHNRNWSV